MTKCNICGKKLFAGGPTCYKCSSWAWRILAAGLGILMMTVALWGCGGAVGDITDPAMQNAWMNGDCDSVPPPPTLTLWEIHDLVGSGQKRGEADHVCFGWVIYGRQVVGDEYLQDAYLGVYPPELQSAEELPMDRLDRLMEEECGLCTFEVFMAARGESR